MAMAARIFGDHVGSTAPVFLAFLAVHVLAGLTAVITGAAAALVRKGSPQEIAAAPATSSSNTASRQPRPTLSSWPRRHCASCSTARQSRP